MKIDKKVDSSQLKKLYETAEDLGDLSRSDDFREDDSLPKNCYQVDEKDYRGSGYDQAKPGAARSHYLQKQQQQGIKNHD